jgi:hypothetical protein
MKSSVKTILRGHACARAIEKEVNPELTCLLEPYHLIGRVKSVVYTLAQAKNDMTLKKAEFFMRCHSVPPFSMLPDDLLKHIFDFLWVDHKNLKKQQLLYEILASLKIDTKPFTSGLVVSTLLDNFITNDDGDLDVLDQCIDINRFSRNQFSEIDNLKSIFVLISFFIALVFLVRAEADLKSFKKGLEELEPGYVHEDYPGRLLFIENAPDLNEGRSRFLVRMNLDQGSTGPFVIDNKDDIYDDQSILIWLQLAGVSSVRGSTLLPFQLLLFFALALIVLRASMRK